MGRRTGETVIPREAPPVLARAVTVAPTEESAQPCRSPAFWSRSPPPDVFPARDVILSPHGVVFLREPPRDARLCWSSGGDRRILPASRGAGPPALEAGPWIRAGDPSVAPIALCVIGLRAGAPSGSQAGVRATGHEPARCLPSKGSWQGSRCALRRPDSSVGAFPSRDGSSRRLLQNDSAGGQEKHYQRMAPRVKSWAR
jgi:hypothetical protein